MTSVTGIPISICILWAMVARRAGIQCHLTAKMPRHVIVVINENLFVDAFQGQVLDRAGVDRLCMSQGPSSLYLVRLMSLPS